MKKVLCLTLALLFALSAISALAYDPEEYGGTMYIVNCREWVTLRSGPSTSSPRLLKVPLNAKVYVYDQQGPFCRCEYRGVDGWILAIYLGY